MLATPLVLATIAFLAPGRVERKTFNDGTVRAEIRYRIATERGRVPSKNILPHEGIARGSLSIDVRGRRRRYDLADVLPIRTHFVLLPNSSEDGCGTTTSLQRVGPYLVIEAILAEKGCLPVATFIDIDDGRISRSVPPPQFASPSMRVDRTDRVVVSRALWDRSNTESTAPWPFAVVRWHAGGKIDGLLACELTDVGPRAPAR